MELSQIRQRIDELNGELLRLFEERMALCAQVAEEKKKNGMEVFAPVREVEILNWVRQTASPELAGYDVSFFNGLMALSRQYQSQLLDLGPSPAGIPSGIRTERLELFPLDMQAAPAVYSLTSDPEVARYMRFDTHTRPEQTEELIREWTSGGNLSYVVLKNDGEFVGVFSIQPDKEAAGVLNMSLFLSPDHWGQGYCGEITELAVKMARDILHGKMLRAYVRDANTPSRKALEKAGFAQARGFAGEKGAVLVYEYLLERQ